MMKSTFPTGTRVVKTSKTTKSEGSNESVTTAWTFVLDGCTVEQMVESAIRSEVIRLQGRIRTGWKKDGKPPVNLSAPKVEIKMADLLAGRGGIVPTVASVTSAIDALPEADRKALLEALLKQAETDEDQE